MADDPADDTSIEDVVFQEREKTGEGPLLRRLTLPHTEAPKLLRLLSHEGITAATMFPGADGVVKGMQERKLWDRKDDGPDQTRCPTREGIQ